jgi:hypothetical protein
VTYTLRATDPSGNETVLECEVSVDSDGLDHDLDTIPDRDDNCVFTPNTDQVDSDLDLIGDACDPSPFDGLIAQGNGACQTGDAGGLVALFACGLLLALRRRARRPAV